jgi:hypothetical protein
MRDTKTQCTVVPNVVSDLLPFDNWLASINRTPTTGWRWRKQGLIRALVINGRLYVSRKDIVDFERRAAAGEFARRRP